VTPRDGNDVDVLVLLEQRLGVERLLERRLGEVDLVGDAAAVDLDLHHVRLLLLQARLADLRVGKHAHDGAVLADALELARDARAVVGRVLLRVLGEGLLLAAVPVLVEAALDLVGQVLGPHSGERAQAARRLDVADDTDDDHRRRLDDRDGLDDLTLVHLRAGAVEVAHDVRHAGLVAHHGREVDRLLGVVLGEPAASRASALRLCGSSVCGWRRCRCVFIGLSLCARRVAISLVTYRSSLSSTCPSPAFLSAFSLLCHCRHATLTTSPFRGGGPRACAAGSRCGRLWVRGTGERRPG
jgi:hypothetical protein